MLIKKYWHPTLNGNFEACPIPFRLDTYKGCSYGCVYCFARQVTEYGRSKAKNALEVGSSFSRLEGLDYEKFERWMERTVNSEIDYDKAYKVALLERIPMKIGCMADPFPVVESTEKITYNTLKILDKYDYPVSISTKNPRVLADYYEDFNNPNWTIAVTIISSDKNLCEKIEPNAPDIDDRFKAIEKLTSLGAKVIVRIQPIIFPQIMDNLDELILKIKDSGAFGFVLEGLKIGMSQTQREQNFLSILSDYVGYDVRKWYKTNCVINSTTYELPTNMKMIYINKAKELAQKYNLECFVGDNDCRTESCNGECCGTKHLRNHNTVLTSENLQNCKVNFKCSYGSSDKKYKNTTIKSFLEEKENAYWNK